MPNRVQSGSFRLTGPAGQSFPLDQEPLVVGREVGVGLRLDDPAISRHHARIERRADGQMWLVDSSVNGTFVNDQRVRERRLEAGDRIRFGLSPTHTYVFSAAQGPAASPAAPATAYPASLQLVVDQYRIERLDLTVSPMLVGSEPGAQGIAINYAGLAPRHIELRRGSDGRWSVRPVAPGFETWLNQAPLESETVLQTGDALRLGSGECLLLFRQQGATLLTVRDFALERARMRLGRAPENDIHLDHPSVSRFHAELLQLHDGTYELADRGSSNGTFVNGVRIEKQRLSAGDRIAFGAVPMVFDGERLEAASAGTRFRLSCRELERSVRDHLSGKPLVLLNKVSLVVQPGELVGLLGPSGSGKTTLMNALNGRQPADRGHVLLNGWDLYREFESLRSTLGSVPQDDILHRQLTVRQCLYYSARLRLPGDTTDKEIWQRVGEVMHILELGERANVEITQLSGGQRKRVSLGIELLAKPGLLFLDEPTAGQDPRTEMKMMQLFRNIASQGSSVLLTTHLLGSFSLLDKVAVLVRGQLAYFGPGEQMLPYFNQSQPGGVYDALGEHKPEEWARRFADSELYGRYIASQLEDPVSAPPKGASAPAAAPAAAPPASTPHKGGAWRTLSTLVARQFTLKFAQPMAIVHALWPLGVVGLLVGAMKGPFPNDPKTLFITMLAALWFGGSLTVRELADERAIYHRERQRNLSLTAYLASKIVYAAVVALAQCLLFESVLTLTGAQAHHFLAATGLMWLLAFEGVLIGLIISASVARPDQALQYFPLVMIPELLLAGLFLPITPLHWSVIRQVPQQQTQFYTVHVPHEVIPSLMPEGLRRTVSPLMVSRWGLEALDDLYIHDKNFAGLPQPYSLILSNALVPSLQPNMPARIRQAYLNFGKPPSTAPAPPRTDPPPRNAMEEYLGILAIFAVVMTLLAAGILRLREALGGSAE